MAKVLPGIDAELAAWMEAQPLFFNATAPLAENGHVNLSPRGLDTFRVLGTREVAYLDLTGSGNESAAHLAENGRITIMFCAFEGRPKVVRLYGEGSVVLPSEPEWDSLRSLFPGRIKGERQIVRVDVRRIQVSCGFGVPLMAYQGQREELQNWAVEKGPVQLKDYHRRKNALSIDGLPAPWPAE
jgi:hypothetical protein